MVVGLLLRESCGGGRARAGQLAVAQPIADAAPQPDNESAAGSGADTKAGSSANPASVPDAVTDPVAHGRAAASESVGLVERAASAAAGLAITVGHHEPIAVGCTKLTSGEFARAHPVVGAIGRD